MRLKIVQEQGVPPYMIFHDNTLKEISVHQPLTKQDLLSIPGIGDRKAELYGNRCFLQLIF